MNIIRSIATVLTVVAPTLALAAPNTPTALKGVQTVSRTDVAQASSSGSAKIVDFRPAKQFSGGTISGASNCPGITQEPTELSAAEVAKAKTVIAACPAFATADKSKDIIVFCGSPTCWISPKAATALAGSGYTNVKWYRGGFSNWKAGASK